MVFLFKKLIQLVKKLTCLNWLAPTATARRSQKEKPTKDVFLSLWSKNMLFFMFFSANGSLWEMPLFVHLENVRSGNDADGIETYFPTDFEIIFLNPGAPKSYNQFRNSP